MALVTVLLLLSVMFVMAVAVQLGVLLEASLSRNRLLHAAGAAEAHGHLVHAMYVLEADLVPGAGLPDEPPLLPGLVSWERVDEETFHIVVASSGLPRVSAEATIRPGPAGRMIVLQRR